MATTTFYFKTGVNYRHELSNGKVWDKNGVIAVVAETVESAFDFVKGMFGNAWRVPEYFTDKDKALKGAPNGIVGEYYVPPVAGAIQATTPQQLTAQQLALYLGCEIAGLAVPDTHINFELLRDWSNGHGVVGGQPIWKPVLRKLSSLTEDELRGYNAIVDRLLAISMGEFAEWKKQFKIAGVTIVPHIGIPELWQYLLSLGIDLFGWIDAGLAIDKATLQEPQKRP